MHTRPPDHKNEPPNHPAAVTDDRADPERIGGILAGLRAEWRDVPLHRLADGIDWATAVRYDEPIDAYRARVAATSRKPAVS